MKRKGKSKAPPHYDEAVKILLYSFVYHYLSKEKKGQFDAKIEQMQNEDLKKALAPLISNLDHTNNFPAAWSSFAAATLELNPDYLGQMDLIKKGVKSVSSTQEDEQIRAFADLQLHVKTTLQELSSKDFLHLTSMLNGLKTLEHDDLKKEAALFTATLLTSHQKHPLYAKSSVKEIFARVENLQSLSGTRLLAALDAFDQTLGNATNIQ